MHILIVGLRIFCSAKENLIPKEKEGNFAMRHLTALVMKLAMTVVVTQIVLGIFTNLRTAEILLVALAITGITYLIGDLLILYVLDNAVAAVGDAGMCWLIIYLGNYIWPERTVSLMSALAAAVIIGIGEIFIHMYVEKYIFKKIAPVGDSIIIK